MVQLTYVINNEIYCSYAYIAVHLHTSSGALA